MQWFKMSSDFCDKEPFAGAFRRGKAYEVGVLLAITSCANRLKVKVDGEWWISIYVDEWAKKFGAKKSRFSKILDFWVTQNVIIFKNVDTLGTRKLLRFQKSYFEMLDSVQFFDELERKEREKRKKDANAQKFSQENSENDDDFFSALKKEVAQNEVI